MCEFHNIVESVHRKKGRQKVSENEELQKWDRKVSGVYKTVHRWERYYTRLINKFTNFKPELNQKKCFLVNIVVIVSENQNWETKKKMFLL